MPTVKCIGHDLAYPVSDVLRLFFGPGVQADGDLLRAGDAEPLIISHAMPESDGWRVTTSSETGREPLEFSAAIPASLLRREVKRQLYQCLSTITGLKFPWGSLTGIRPTQVAAEAIRQNENLESARNELTDRWFVTSEKAGLALETALAEAALLANVPQNSAMVYLGVPFCPTRCSYCSFIAQDALFKAALLGPYVEAVLAETRGFYAGLAESLPVSAVYVGGGTPTSLPDLLFERLLRGVLEILPTLADAELTVEAGRPDTITPEKLAIIQSVRATRLCINPQTFHDATLDRIGRRHTTRQTIDAFRMARSMGFTSINMDLIAGLPGETPEDFSDSLDQALALGPDSITVHTLAMKRSSRLSQARVEQGGHPGLPDQALAAMLEHAGSRLRTAGLYPYYLYRQKDVAGGLENTGFARPGQGCLYNVGMMSDQCSVIGLGSGAMSKRVTGSRVERAPNPRDIADYIARTTEMVSRKLALFTPGTE